MTVLNVMHTLWPQDFTRLDRRLSQLWARGFDGIRDPMQGFGPEYSWYAEKGCFDWYLKVIERVKRVHRKQAVFVAVNAIPGIEDQLPPATKARYIQRYTNPWGTDWRKVRTCAHAYSWRQDYRPAIEWTKSWCKNVAAMLPYGVYVEVNPDVWLWDTDWHSCANLIRNEAMVIDGANPLGSPGDDIAKARAFEDEIMACFPNATPFRDTSFCYDDDNGVQFQSMRGGATKLIVECGAKIGDNRSARLLNAINAAKFSQPSCIGAYSGPASNLAYLVKEGPAAVDQAWDRSKYDALLAANPSFARDDYGIWNSPESGYLYYAGNAA